MRPTTLRIALFLALVCVLLAGLQAQVESEPAFCIEWNGVDGYDVLVQGFDDIESAQFSLRWDTTMAEFRELIPVDELTDPTDFFLENTDQGEITMVWARGGVTPRSLLDGEIFFTLLMDVSSVELGAPYITDAPLEYEIADVDGNVYSDLRAMPTCARSVRSGSLVRGSLLVDADLNCEPSPTDRSLSNTILAYRSAIDTVFARTDQEGNYSIELSPGAYLVEPILEDFLFIPCEAYTIIVTDVTAIDTLDLLVQESNVCASVQIDMIHSAAIPCEETLLRISYDNRGTDVASGYFIDIAWDPTWTFVGSASAVVRITDELYRFLLPDVDPQTGGVVELRVFLDCDVEDGSSHAIDARVLPVVYCEEVSADWSRASLEVEAECEGDSVKFTIRNVGIIAMAEPLDGIILEDDLGGFINDILLPPGEEYIESREANGATWSLMIPQVPNHPGASHPAVSVEACNDGASMNSIGFRSDYAEDDEDVFIDRDLLLSDRGELSLKSALPTGYGVKHYVSANRSIEYTLRYQNTTGTTLDRLSFVDDIPPSLDVESLSDIQSSHPVKVFMNPDGSINFSFSDLLLPDSSISQYESQIYVSYRLSPVDDIEPGTVIENSGEIYIGFDRAARTDGVFHTVIDSLGPIITSLLDIPYSRDLLMSPNPVSTSGTIHINNVPPDDRSTWRLIRADGRTVQQSALVRNSIDLSPYELPPAWYLLQVHTQTGDLYQSIVIITP